MKATKFLLGLAVLLVAAVGAYAAANNFKAVQAFYQIGVAGTATEDCVSFNSLKNCEPGAPTCIDNTTPDGSKLLYDERVPIGETGRFHCQVELEELP